MTRVRFIPAAFPPRVSCRYLGAEDYAGFGERNKAEVEEEEDEAWEVHGTNTAGEGSEMEINRKEEEEEEGDVVVVMGHRKGVVKPEPVTTTLATADVLVASHSPSLASTAPAAPPAPGAGAPAAPNASTTFTAPAVPMTMAQRLAAMLKAKQDAAKAAGILTASTNQELRAEINMLKEEQAVAAPAPVSDASAAVVAVSPTVSLNATVTAEAEVSVRGGRVEVRRRHVDSLRVAAAAAGAVAAAAAVDKSSDSTAAATVAAVMRVAPITSKVLTNVDDSSKGNTKAHNASVGGGWILRRLHPEWKDGKHEKFLDLRALLYLLCPFPTHAMCRRARHVVNN